jgi:hexulose-6-phosphate isomerase
LGGIIRHFGDNRRNPEEQTMATPTSRRAFLKQASALSAAATVAGVAGTPRASAAPLPTQTSGGSPKKAVLISMLPRDLSYQDRFTLAKDVGFAAVEMQTVDDPAEAETIAKASQATGFPIHCVMNAEHWRSPLSSADPAVVERSVQGMRTSIRNAQLWGAGAVLLVPAVVNAATGYQDAWTRSTRVIRERLLPEAEKAGVIIAVEEVWNKFLLSPIEMSTYVDSFGSKYLQAYFDVGNVMFYGFPQDWIRTLGPRICRVHVKDFKVEKNTYSWMNLGEGAVDWPEVRRALHEIGYDGYVTTEIAAGDRVYLADVVARLDRFLAGQRPVA